MKIAEKRNFIKKSFCLFSMSVFILSFIPSIIECHRCLFEQRKTWFTRKRLKIKLKQNNEITTAKNLYLLPKKHTSNVCMYVVLKSKRYTSFDLLFGVNVLLFFRKKSCQSEYDDFDQKSIHYFYLGIWIKKQTLNESVNGMSSPFIEFWYYFFVCYIANIFSDFKLKVSLHHNHSIHHKRS